MIPFLSRLNNEAAHVFNDTFLRVTAYNSAPTPPLISYRIESYVKDGTKDYGTEILKESVTEGENQFTPTADRLASTSFMNLREGMLYSVRVSTSTAAIKRGQCYVVVQLQKGAGAGGYIFRTLFADYLVTNQSLTFPGSDIVSPTSGSGNFNQYGALIGGTITVPANVRFRVLKCQMIITTDGTAGNRLVQPYAIIAGTTHRMALSPAVPPGQSAWIVQYSNFGTPPAQFVSVLLATRQFAFDSFSELWLDTADTVLFDQNLNFTAADLAASSGSIYVEEWINF